MSEPRTEAGKRLLRYAQGLQTMFLTQSWLDGILAIEAEAAPVPLDGLREAAQYLLDLWDDVTSNPIPAAGRQANEAFDLLRAALRDEGETPT